MVTFVPLQEAFFVPGERLSEIPPTTTTATITTTSREASGAAGLEGDGSGEAFV